MRILLIHQYFLEKNDSGGSRFNEMTRLWGCKGHSIIVLAGMVHYTTGEKDKRYKGKYTFPDKKFYDNVDVIRTHVSKSYNKSFMGRLWAYFSFVCSSIYAGIFKIKGKFDLILVTSPPLFIGITGYILSKIKKRPLVFEIRDLWPESAIDTNVLKNKFIIKFAFWFEKFIYKKSVLINVLTPAFKEKLINEKGVPEEKIIFIPNAADFSLADKITDTFKVEEFRKQNDLVDKFVITYVGAHGAANHLIQLIDAATRLKDTNVLFQLIGAGMQKKELIEEVKRRNLKNVKFINPVPKTQVFKFILSSEIGAAVLKKVEAFKTIYSNKTFDYMSCKKAVLLLIDGVSKDLIKTARCGIYAEPENVIQIEKKIREIMSLPKEKLSKLGENGYYYAKEHFDRKKLAVKYIEKIKKII